MQEIIRAEQECDETDSRPPPRQRKHSKRKREVFSDPEDKPYASTVASGSDSESDSSSIPEIAPDEVCFRPLNCHVCLHRF